MRLVKLNKDHYIICDDSEIKEGDLCYDPEGDPGHNGIKYVVKCLRTAPDSYWNKHCKKIIHSTQPKGMENVTFISPREVKELIGKVDVEKKADKMFPNPYFVMEGLDITPAYKEGYVVGYNQALEDNKEKKYTEEDIRNAWEAGMQFIGEDKGSFGEFFQSIQPKTEWEVELIDGQLKQRQ